MIYISKLECVDLWSTNCKIDLWPVDLGIDATHHLIMGYIGATYKAPPWNMQCPKEQTQAPHAGRMERRIDGLKPIYPPSHTSLWVRYNDCEIYICRFIHTFLMGQWFKPYPVWYISFPHSIPSWLIRMSYGKDITINLGVITKDFFFTKWWVNARKYICS